MPPIHPKCGFATTAVPGDFNSQTPELKHYEGNVWYRRFFTAKKDKDHRQFLYFAGVSYQAAVWLNSTEVGRHEGGFTPFQIVAHGWSEEYQEEIYRKNYLMFANIPNLRGTCSWVLFDFRSPTRCHPQNQDGWNRKGLVSDKGQRKKAWWVVRKFYDER